jgi:predicted GIY-YIG superfamily endonuclease
MQFANWVPTFVGIIGILLLLCSISNRLGHGLLLLHRNKRSKRHALHRADRRPHRPHQPAQAEANPGFTSRYGCDQLVWFCAYDTREAAVLQERKLKEWRRDWKLELIETSNPDWLDLYWEACGIHDPSKPYVVTGLDRPETHP